MIIMKYSKFNRDLQDRVWAFGISYNYKAVYEHAAKAMAMAMPENDETNEFAVNKRDCVPLCCNSLGYTFPCGAICGCW